MKLTQPVWPRFFSTPTVLAVATLGPVGMKLPAPGTWGSVAGLLFFTVVAYPLGDVALVIFSAMLAYIAVGFCGEAEFRMGRKDPGEVILDEFVSMPLCFVGWRYVTPDVAPWIVFLSGLALFRLFDITKIFGIRRLQELPGGWGVVIDDTAAAIAACVTLHLAHWAWLAGSK